MPEWIPSGNRLAVDRRFTSNTVLNDIQEWKRRGTNRTDLRNVDTRGATGSLTRQRLRSLGHGYISQEADRFTRVGQVSRNLIEREKHRIYNFRSFVAVLRETWGRDASLRELLDPQNSNTSDFRALYETSVVQGWQMENVREIGVTGLMERMNINQRKATTIFKKLDESNQQRLVESILEGKRFRISRATQVVRPRQRGIRRRRVRLVSQRSSSGRTYERQAPQRWTDLQIRFVTNIKRTNPNITYRQIANEYNRVFREAPRTPRSLSNKIVRLGI